jgi:hypothetical protein
MKMRLHYGKVICADRSLVHRTCHHQIVLVYSEPTARMGPHARDGFVFTSFELYSPFPHSPFIIGSGKIGAALARTFASSLFHFPLTGR